MEQPNQHNLTNLIYSAPDTSPECYLRALHPNDGCGQPAMFAKLDEKVVTRRSSVEEICLHLPSWLDCTSYVSLNRFSGRRSNRNVADLNALYLDLDVHTKWPWKSMEISDVQEVFLDIVQKANIQRPSVILQTGRGLAVIWLIKPLPGKAMKRWRAANKALVKFAEEFGADRACTDPARVFRLPGTLNEKSGQTVCVSWATWERYDFDLLSDKIFVAVGQPTQRELKARKTQQARKTQDRTGNMPIGLTHSQRFAKIKADLEDLREHFGTVPVGTRNTWLHLYSVCLSHQRIATDIAAEIERQARIATPDLSASEVRTIIRSAERELQGRPTPRYYYAGDTIAELLGVDEKLARELCLRQIMPMAERRRRKAEREAKHRAEKGAQSRAEWEATHSREKDAPWKAEGISRATFYRRQKAAHAAQEALPQKAESVVKSLQDSPEATNAADVRLVRARYRGNRRFLTSERRKEERSNEAIQPTNRRKRHSQRGWTRRRKAVGQSERTQERSATPLSQNQEWEEENFRSSRLSCRALLDEGADGKPRPADRSDESNQGNHIGAEDLENTSESPGLSAPHITTGPAAP